MTRADFLRAWRYVRSVRSGRAAIRPPYDVTPACWALGDRGMTDPLRYSIGFRLARAGYQTALRCDGRPPRIIREQTERRAAA